MPSYEVNFDGIVGPTHNYSGLSYGNVASLTNQKAISNPKQAALQGLRKMKMLADLGIKQAVIPPQDRPHLPTLRALGFTGSDKEVILKAFRESPDLFYACCSASSMWTANAATVSPSSDSSDRRVHITPANLYSKMHRAIESDKTAILLKQIFRGEHFEHHPPLGPGSALADEGAANHTRFCKAFGKPGVELFVYGRSAMEDQTHNPVKFPARQTLEASHAIARLHKLDSNRTIFAKQNPLAIDAGVFHNDVISVGHQNLFFYHELAFVNTEAVVNEICQKVESSCNCKMDLILVPAKEVSLEDAVKSYLFNSQIVTLPNGKNILLAPSECETIPSVHRFLAKLIGGSISNVHFVNLRESMQNGGGPACLRLRVVLSEAELKSILPSIFLTDTLYEKLTAWVERHYRERLIPEDLLDPMLYLESHAAYMEILNILKLNEK